MCILFQTLGYFQNPFNSEIACTAFPTIIFKYVCLTSSINVPAVRIWMSFIAIRTQNGLHVWLKSVWNHQTDQYQSDKISCYVPFMTDKDSK